MKAKLIKKDDGQPDGGFYILQGLNRETIEGKLSLKNCQAIERGYDLDELAKEGVKFHEQDEIHRPNSERIYKKAFQKAVELMGDKKFTEEDLREAYSRGQTNSPIQSIQQNEWEVEIEMETISSGRFIVIDYSEDPPKTIIDDPLPSKEQRPKLDADGCLILKRVV